MKQHTVALLAFLLVIASCFSAWYFFLKPKNVEQQKPVESEGVQALAEKKVPFDPNAELPEPVEEFVYDQLDVGIEMPRPQALMEKLAGSIESGAWEETMKILGKEALSPESMQELRDLIGQPGFRLSDVPFSEVGESRVNRAARWSLNVESPEPRRIFLDLERQKNGWGVNSLTLPSAEENAELDQMADALGVADAFIQNALKQSFDAALKHADLALVSDAKVAGLCILFEEGEYRLRKRKPLRAVYNREANAGFLVNVETKQGENAAQFGLNLKKNDQGEWKVVDVVLDSLLADYAERVESGDIYYSPLIKNPQGGDKLVIYFEFDEDGLTERMCRQLDIMATVLRLDRKRKISLTGHADALGSDDYNKTLSAKRARVVRDYLSEKGVRLEQINTLAAGEAKPLRPNVRSDGTDDPGARRVNRRTEIYLDF